MISVASEKNISTAKKRDIAPFKVNGQSHIILLSCGTRSKVSFVSNPAQISLKHSSQLTNKTTLATSFIYCVNQMFIQFTIKSSWKYQSILNQYCHTKLQDLLQNPSKSLSNTQQLANQLYGGEKQYGEALNVSNADWIWFIKCCQLKTGALRRHWTKLDDDYQSQDIW